MIDEILKHNAEFVETKGYEKFVTSKYPDKRIAIVTCMDTRLVELLPAALGVRNGDVKIIKNAGGTEYVLRHDYEPVRFDYAFPARGRIRTRSERNNGRGTHRLRSAGHERG